MRALALCAAAALAPAACAPPPSVERDPEPLLQTEGLRYALAGDELGYSAAIPFTFRNATGGPVYLDACAGDVRPILEMDRNGIWFPAWEPYRPRCRSAPVVIPRGATYADTLELFGAPAGSNVLPTFVFPELEGVYRLVWTGAYASFDTVSLEPGAALPPEQRVSNPFVLLR